MRFYASLFLFMISLAVSCQSDSSYIPVAAYWQKGDVYDFKITKIKRKWQDKKLVWNDSSQYVARFLVSDTDTSSYTIQWTFSLFDILDLPEDSRKKYPSCQNAVLIYKTDEFGVFDRIINWQEISRMINDLVNELIEVKNKEANTDINDLRRSFEPILAVYNSQRGIEQLVFKELQMLHFPFGKQYQKGQIYNYTEKIPIMVNSDPATGNGIIFIRQTNLDKQRCEIVQRMKILPDSAKKMLRSHFHSIGMKPEAIGGAIESSVVEVNDENIYDYYYFPGVPVKISVSRETLINVLEDKIKQTDITLIEHIEP